MQRVDSYLYLVFRPRNKSIILFRVQNRMRLDRKINCFVKISYDLRLTRLKRAISVNNIYKNVVRTEYYFNLIRNKIFLAASS